MNPVGRRSTRCLDAQAAIEFVLVLPILLMLMAFAVDIANLWNSRSQIESVSAEGARMLSADPTMTDAELADELAATSGLGDSIRVSVSRRNLPDKSVTLKSAGKTAEAKYTRQSATVTVSADVPTLMPLADMGVDAAASGAVRITSTSSTILSALGRK